MKFAYVCALLAVVAVASAQSTTPDVSFVTHDLQNGIDVSSIIIPFNSANINWQFATNFGVGNCNFYDISLTAVDNDGNYFGEGTIQSAVLSTANQIQLQFSTNSLFTRGTTLRFRCDAGTFTTNGVTTEEFYVDLRLFDSSLDQSGSGGDDLSYGTLSVSGMNPDFAAEVSLHDPTTPVRINNDEIIATFSRSVIKPTTPTSITLTAYCNEAGTTPCLNYPTYTISSANGVPVGDQKISFNGEFSNEISFKITDDGFFQKGRTYRTSNSFLTLVEPVDESAFIDASPQAYSFSFMGDACDVAAGAQDDAGRRFYQDGNGVCDALCEQDIQSTDTTLPAALVSAGTELTGNVLTIQYTEHVKYMHNDYTVGQDGAGPNLDFMDAAGVGSTDCLDHFRWTSVSTTGCQRTWTGTIDALTFFNGATGETSCKFEDVTTDGSPNTEILIRFQVTNYEVIEAVFDVDGTLEHAKFLSRELTQLMPFKIAFPKQVTVSDSTVSVYSAINVLRALTEQITINAFADDPTQVGDQSVVPTMTLQVLTNSNTPYVMINPTASGTPVANIDQSTDWALAEFQTLADGSALSCTDSSGGGNCEQLWEAKFEIPDTTLVCEFDGVYSFDLDVACRENVDTPCPVGADTQTVTISLNIDTASACSFATASVGLTTRTYLSDSLYAEPPQPLNIAHAEPAYVVAEASTVDAKAVLKNADILHVSFTDTTTSIEYTVYTTTGFPALSGSNFGATASQATNTDLSDASALLKPTMTFLVLTNDMGLTGTATGEFNMKVTIGVKYSFDTLSDGTSEFTVLRSHKVRNGRALRNYLETATTSTNVGVVSTLPDEPAEEVTVESEGSHMNATNGVFVAAGVVAIACVAAAFVAVVRLQQAKKRAANQRAEMQNKA